MRRRALIATTVGATVWPPGARAQQPANRLLRVGVLMDLAADDPEGQARLAAFREELGRLGWVDDTNARIDVRWGAGAADRMRQYAQELVALRPAVILASGSPAVAPLAASTLPIVFVTVIDPVGAGFVTSMARPGGNITGFMALEYSIGTKWLQLLKDVAPTTARVAVLRDAALPSGSRQLVAIQTVATASGVELSPIGMGDVTEIASGVAAFARDAKGGLIVTSSTLSLLHRDLIVALAAKYGLPAVYSNRLFAHGGGLLSYSPDRIDQFRQAAVYVDRILRGEKPAGLPVQAPSKYELLVNLKTAKVLGLSIPPSILARADEVIE